MLWADLRYLNSIELSLALLPLVKECHCLICQILQDTFLLKPGAGEGNGVAEVLGVGVLSVFPPPTVGLDLVRFPAPLVTM